MILQNHTAANSVNTQTLSLPDGRKLGYTTIGTGKPVIYFHGTASSRLEVLLLGQLAESGLRLIGVDRPGYGLSTYTPRRGLTDFNGDLTCLADFAAEVATRQTIWYC